jgi:hypothetical protein
MAPTVAAGHERKTARCKAKPDVGVIEIEAEGVTIRAGRGADAAMIAAIVHVLEEGVQKHRHARRQDRSKLRRHDPSGCGRDKLSMNPNRP